MALRDPLRKLATGHWPLATAFLLLACPGPTTGTGPTPPGGGGDGPSTSTPPVQPKDGVLSNDAKRYPGYMTQTLPPILARPFEGLKTKELEFTPRQSEKLTLKNGM